MHEAFNDGLKVRVLLALKGFAFGKFRTQISVLRTGFSDWDFSCFYSVLPAKYWDI